MVSFDFKKLDTPSIYKLLIGSVVPRPIAFVSSLSAKGVGNLAPFSFFNAVSAKPPTLMFSIAYKTGGIEKDTLANIRQTKEFVVNLVNEALLEKMHQSSAEYDSEINEFEAVGLTPIASLDVKPPRVKESPVHWECKLEQIVPVGEKEEVSNHIVLGRIVRMHVKDGVVDERMHVDFNQLRPVARIGGRGYVKAGETVTLWDPNSRMKQT